MSFSKIFFITLDCFAFVSGLAIATAFLLVLFAPLVAAAA